MRADVEAGLTEEVHRFVAQAGTRRALPLRVHVGVPGGSAVRFVDECGGDAVLRADHVGSALSEQPAASYVWLTRGGPLEPDDRDHEWYAAARAAFAGHGVPLHGFVVITRSGWCDLVGGESRRWVRVRPARRRPGGSARPRP